MSRSFNEWFAVLPVNAPDAQRAAAILTATAPDAGILARRGGRPWIIGRTRRPILAVHCRDTSAAIIGTHAQDEPALLRRLRAMKPNGSAQMLMGLPGSYHSVLTRRDTTSVCGDIAGMRPVFWTRIGETVVASDRAQVLAATHSSTQLDLSHLALYLLGPLPPLGLAESGSSPFENVRSTPPGSILTFDSVGHADVRRWWKAPDDEADGEQGAMALRMALSRAVDIHCGTATVGCELSGDADSALSGLAHATRGPVVNFSRARTDGGINDVEWARRAAAAQPGSKHHVLDVSALPHQFAGWEAPLNLDAPSQCVASPARSRFWWRYVADFGVDVLLSGKGGDEVSFTAPTYLAHARRRDWRTARRHIKGWAALRGISPRQIRAGGGDPGPYPAWLAACLSPKEAVSFGWEAPTNVPPWLTPVARDRLNDVLVTAGPRAEPLHERPHQHATIAAIRGLARWNRLQADSAARFGIQVVYPFTDGTVIEAALATRAEARTDPHRNKPVLAAAMAGIVSAEDLPKAAGDGYSTNTAAGITYHRRLLTQLLSDDCQLARYGLIDTQHLSTMLAGWPDCSDASIDLLLHLTVMCEVWARTAENRPLPSAVHSPEGWC